MVGKASHDQAFGTLGSLIPTPNLTRACLQPHLPAIFPPPPTPRGNFACRSSAGERYHEHIRSSVGIVTWAKTKTKQSDVFFLNLITSGQTGAFFLTFFSWALGVAVGRTWHMSLPGCT